MHPVHSSYSALMRSQTRVFLRGECKGDLISINLLRAIWEAVSAILTFAQVTLFRGDEDVAVSSGMRGSTDMPGTTARGINNLLLSLPTDI